MQLPSAVQGREFEGEECQVHVKTALFAKLVQILDHAARFRSAFVAVLLGEPAMPNSISGPRLLPRRPESIWLSWATALVASPEG